MGEVANLGQVANLGEVTDLRTKIAESSWVAGALVTQTRLFVAAKATHETTIFLKAFVSVI